MSGNTGIFRLKLRISFLSLSIAGSNWLACLRRIAQDRPPLRLSQVDLQLHRVDPFGLLVCPRHGTKFRADTRSWHTRWDPTIVMVVYNNNDILMVHYKDLPDGDKGVISKAIEEF